MSASHLGAPIRDAAILGGPASVAIDRESFLDRVSRLEAVLSQHADEPGSVVALLADPSPAALEVVAAARRAGIVLLPLDPRFSLEELAFVVNLSEATTIVAEQHHSYTAASLVILTPDVSVRYALDGEFVSHRPIALARSAAVTGVVHGAPIGTMHHALSSGRRPAAYVVPDVAATEWGGRDLKALLGGSTLESTSVVAVGGPLYDPVAMRVLTAAQAAAAVVALPARDSGIEVLRACFEYEASVVQLTARQALEIADLDRGRARRLASPSIELLLAPSPLPASVVEALHDVAGDALRLVYTAPGVGVVAALDGAVARRHAHTVGRPLVPVRIDSPEEGNGRVLAARPDRADSWKDWGDVGFIDDDGLLNVVSGTSHEALRLSEQRSPWPLR